MKYSSARILILIFLAVFSRFSFAEEDCMSIASEAEDVEAKFTARCKGAIAQKGSLDNQAAYVGQIESGPSANIEVGAGSLNKVANFHGGTSLEALGLCRTAIAQSKAELHKIKDRLVSAGRKAVADKDQAEAEKCIAAMDKTSATIDKLIASYQEKQASLMKGMSGAGQAAAGSAKTRSVAGGSTGSEVPKDSTSAVSPEGLQDSSSAPSKAASVNSPRPAAAPSPTNFANDAAYRPTIETSPLAPPETAVAAAPSTETGNSNMQNVQTALMATQLAGSMGNMAKGMGGKESSASSSSPAALPPVRLPSQQQAAAPVESCTTAATGLGTEECQAILAKRNPALIQVANSDAKPTISTASVGISEGSVVAKAYGASLLKSNSTTLSSLCKNNELVGCQDL